MLTAATVAAATLGLAVPAANASTNLIVSYKGVPADWHALSFPCDPSGSLSAYSPAHVTGPAAPPSGQGSARIAGSATSSPILFFGPADSPLVSTLSAFDAYVYIPSSAAATPEFDMEVSDGETDYSLHIAAAGTGWVHLDTTGSTVLNYDAFNNQTNVESSGTTTLSDFKDAHSTATFNTFVISPESCGAGTYYLDDVHYAVGTTDNTVDFEAPLPASLTNGSHPTSVVTGAATTLTATLASAGTPLGDQPVSLYAHGVGTSWHLVTTRTSDANGAVSAKVASTSTTTYQWRYAASGTNYAPVNASSVLITSRQLVVISSKPTSTAYRGTAVIKGRITPHKTGVTVQLVRLVSGKRVVVASTKTVSGGYFTLKAPMNARGTYSYVVAALPYTGEALGQSPSFKIATK